MAGNAPCRKSIPGQQLLCSSNCWRAGGTGIPSRAAEVLWGRTSPPCITSLDTGGGSKTKLKMRAAISHTGKNPTHLMQRVSALLGMRKRGNHSLPGGKLTAARGSAGSFPCWGEWSSLENHGTSSTPLGGAEMACRDHDWEMLWILYTWNDWQGWKQDLECSCDHK